MRVPLTSCGRKEILLFGGCFVLLAGPAGASVGVAALGRIGVPEGEG
jgi:hypothetical protein